MAAGCELHCELGDIDAEAVREVALVQQRLDT